MSSKKVVKKALPKGRVYEKKTEQPKKSDTMVRYELEQALKQQIDNTERELGLLGIILEDTKRKMIEVRAARMVYRRALGWCVKGDLKMVAATIRAGLK